jgi:hypothetical protein
MSILNARRPRRHLTLLTLAASVAAGPLAAVASADQPVFEMPARFDRLDASGGSLVPDGPPSFGAIRGYPGAGATGGHSALELYCTPYGPGTAIVGFQVLVGRWHSTVGDGALINLDTDAGTWESLTDDALPLRRADARGPWNGPSRVIAPSRCVGVRAVMRRTVTGTTLTWTTDLQRVAIVDEIGPSVGGPVVDVAWVTGDTAPVRWHQSDNSFARGGTWAEIVGGGRASLGDQPDGSVGAAIPVGALGDGVHTLRVHRDAPGWTTATAETPVRIDRTPPPVPGLSISTEAWTNAATVWVDSTPSVDGGSGWVRNEFRVDGGPWVARGTRWGFTQAGRHTVEARAVDDAGLVSAPSAPRVVRIDRTSPVLRDLLIDTGAAGGPRLSFGLTDQGGSGLGDCPLEVALARPGGAWNTVIEGVGDAFAPRADLRLPMGSAAGEHQVRVSACDTAGNRVAQSARFVWTQAAARVGATSPGATAAGSGVVATAEGGRLRVVRLRTRGAVAGGTLRLSGRLALVGGGPAPAGPLRVEDPRGRTVGAGAIVAGGRFSARARATRGGLWRLRATGRNLQAASFRLRVAPRVVVRTASGHGVTHLGVRIVPGVAGRAVVVQVRGLTGWVPLRGARTGAHGTARFSVPAGLGAIRVVVRPGRPPADGPAIVPVP